MENRTRQDDMIRIKAGWSVYGKYREIFLDRHLPMSLKRKVFNQRVLQAMTCGCQTWSLTKVSTERKMLNVKLQHKAESVRSALGKEQEYQTHSKKESIQPVCLTSNDMWMPNMVSYKSISKEALNKPTSYWKENAKWLFLSSSTCYTVGSYIFALAGSVLGSHGTQ